MNGKLRTALAVGPLNIATVLIYRVLLKLGIHPVQSVRVKPPIGPFFRPPAEIDATLPPISSWNEAGECFGWFRYPLEGNTPEWHSNPITGKAVKDVNRPWWKIPDFDQGVGDIKGVWEASRFAWALSMAQQARRGETDEIDRLNHWLEDWVAKNPPFLGPNWKCGQESSLRVLHLAASAMVLRQIDSTQAGLLDFIAMSLARIAPTRAYAMAQDNNHGTSEGAALFVGGSLLTANGRPEGVKWERQGRDILEERVNRLIEIDGTFSQYSVTYHRMMLDTITFTELWRRRLNLQEFSSSFQQRAAQATRWISSLVNAETGDAPNIGANDGAHLFDYVQSGYRDFRPSVRLATDLFLKENIYQGSAGTVHRWVGIEPSDISATPSRSFVFDNGGFAVLRRNSVMAVLRYPRFRFRPSQADVLHLDLWINGVNHLRDAGSFSYNSGDEWSEYFSGTAAHNTVMFDDRDQMQRLSRFLFGDWLKTARVIPLNESESFTAFGAEYKDRQGATHTREINLSENSLRVRDSVAGFKHKAVLRWRLAPGKWVLNGRELSDGNCRLSVSGDMPIARMELKEGWESLYYHTKSKVPVLEVEVSKPGTLTTLYGWGV